MATALDLANRSLKLILVEAADSPLEADEYQDYYDALNDFMADLESRGVRLGFTPVTNPADTITVPPGALRGIAANMAIEVAPDYGGKVSPLLVVQAREGMRALRRLGQEQISSSYPTGLPRGTGSESYPFRNLTHYEDHPQGVLAFAGNALVTEIAVASTAVKVRGTWEAAGFEVLQGDSAGRISNGTDTQLAVDVDVAFTATCSAAVTGVFTLMKNGAVSLGTSSVSLSSTRASGTISASVTLRSGEYIELWVQNDTDATNITVADAVLEVS